jgi:hypothetical protein
MPQNMQFGVRHLLVATWVVAGVQARFCTIGASGRVFHASLGVLFLLSLGIVIHQRRALPATALWVGPILVGALMGTAVALVDPNLVFGKHRLHLLFAVVVVGAIVGIPIARTVTPRREP